MIFCFKNLIFSEYRWAIPNHSSENETTLVMLFTSKIKFGTFAVQYWKIRLFLNFSSISLNYSYFLVQKAWQLFTHFWKNQNFGLLTQSICVTPDLFDIGGSKGIIWSLPSSNGLVIGSLLASGGRRNHFFGSTVDWWNK